MPMYDYRCSDCGTVYDVFHKVREVTEDVVCPSCTSPHHVRLMSAPSISTGAGSSGASDYSAGPSCGPGGCCGGSCDNWH